MTANLLDTSPLRLNDNDNNLFEKSLRSFLPKNNFFFKFASLQSIEYSIYFLHSAHNYIVININFVNEYITKEEGAHLG